MVVDVFCDMHACRNEMCFVICMHAETRKNASRAYICVRVLLLLCCVLPMGCDVFFLPGICFVHTSHLLEG